MKMFFIKIKRFCTNKTVKVSFELLLVIVSVLVVTYAWFVKTTKNEMDNFVIKTKASRLLYISLDDGETWNTELSLNLDNRFKFNNEVTSNGVVFNKAATKREDGMPITFKEALVGSDYLEFDVLFKCNAALGVFLNNDSFVIPAVGTSESDLIGDSVERKSSYGNFSRDLIAGALRVSFTVNDLVDGEYVSRLEPSLVWAPNKEYELIHDRGTYNFNINSNASQDYRYIDPTNGFEYKNVVNFKDNLKANYDTEDAGGDPMIVKIDPDMNGGIKSVTVRIWVEGNDRETHDALTGGMFKLNLNFLGILKENNSVIPNVEAYRDKIVGFVEGMEYSKDFGNPWTSYEEEHMPLFTNGDIVYVRYAEDENHYPSNKKILNF